MTDRTLRSASDLDGLDFSRTERSDGEGAQGLVPVIAQDASTGDVLMLAFADRSALEATLDSGQMHFWSRSRGELWRKGETSGNTMAVRSLHADCDGDAVLARVGPAGPACHTGERTCFGEGASAGGVLQALDDTLAARQAERPDGSYTVRLLDDANLRLKKLGEESAELVAALATGDRDRAIAEAADLVYHTLVALRAEGIAAEELLRELERRVR